MSILDGRFLPEPAETALEAGRIAQVAVMIGANDRDLGIGSAQSKDELFAQFGSDSSEARRLYDPLGTLHGFEIPFTLNSPAALVGDRVTATDKIMGDLASAYWAQFAKTGDPNVGANVATL